VIDLLVWLISEVQKVASLHHSIISSERPSSVIGKVSGVVRHREAQGVPYLAPGDLFRNAVHNFVQAILGIDVLDRADLEGLSEATASRNRWEFM
jgi:hypothetical protein